MPAIGRFHDDKRLEMAKKLFLIRLNNNISGYLHFTVRI
jgi:hypothetical protein